MIVTVTANPSVDRTIEIDCLRRGEVNRGGSSRVDPGGKGVNVSRVLGKHGMSTVAVLPAGGAEGAQLTQMLAPLGVPVAPVSIEGRTRSNITVVEPDGTTTKLNEPGPTLTRSESGALADKVGELAKDAEWVLLCGSLPRGLDDDFYANLVRAAHAVGARVGVDTSGRALACAIAAGPDVIKPNVEELAELVGQPIQTWGDVIAHAGRLVEGGVANVLVSLGSDGALLVGERGVYHAFSTPVPIRSTVAAGDSTLAGYILAGDVRAGALRNAVAFGTAAVTIPGSGVPGPADVDLGSITVTDQPDPARHLEETA